MVGVLAWWLIVGAGVAGTRRDQVVLLWWLAGWAGLAAHRQGPEPAERGDQVGGPGPGAVDADDDAAGVVDDPAGGMPQAVAQRLGLGDLEVAVQQQGLRPADQGLGDADQGEPGVVGAKVGKRQVAQPGCPGSRVDVVSGTGSCVGSRASRVTRGHHLRSGMA
jgi:hypothetical protein